MATETHTKSTITNSITNEDDVIKHYSSASSSNSSSRGSKVRILPSSTRDSIFCDNMLFKYENQWTDSPECKICSQSFNKLKAIFKHHCRICGECYCGDCSSKKINEERVCDVCYLRVENFDLIEKKKDILALKDQLLEEMFFELNGLSVKKIEVESQIQELKQTLKIDQKKHTDTMGTLREDLKQNSENYKQKLDEYKKLRETMKKDREDYAMKEKNLADVKRTYFSLKDDVQTKENNYKNKVAELAEYMKIFGKMKECESFLHLKISENDLMCISVLRSNSKDHCSFIKSAEKKSRYGLSMLSKYSSAKDLRGLSHSQCSGNNLPNLQGACTLNSRLSSGKEGLVLGKTSICQSREHFEMNGNNVDGGCFCLKSRCQIF